jgi:hypothetical protein
MGTVCAQRQRGFPADTAAAPDDDGAAAVEAK